MIYFFIRQYIFFVMAFFILCANHLTASLNINHSEEETADFFKNFKQNNDQFLDAISFDQTCFVIDQCKKLKALYNGICLSEYRNFFGLIFTIAKKTKFDADFVIRFIHEKYANNFREGIQGVHMYKEIKDKIKFDDVLSVREYNFLTNVLTGKYAVPSNKNTVRVERTFIERYSVTKEELIVYLYCINMWSVINSFGDVYHGIGTFKTSLIFLGFKQFPLSIVLLGIMFGIQNTSPLIKTYQPKINEYSEKI